MVIQELSGIVSTLYLEYVQVIYRVYDLIVKCLGRVDTSIMIMVWKNINIHCILTRTSNQKGINQHVYIYTHTGIHIMYAYIHIKKQNNFFKNYNTHGNKICDFANVYVFCGSMKNFWDSGNIILCVLIVFHLMYDIT